MAKPWWRKEDRNAGLNPWPDRPWTAPSERKQKFPPWKRGHHKGLKWPVLLTVLEFVLLLVLAMSRTPG